MLMFLAAAALLCASFSAALYRLNLRHYTAPPAAGIRQERVSIVIPARNEEASIAEALRTALASTFVELEIIVVNDGSQDTTVDIVRSVMATDDRVRLVESDGLPGGWNGKQHACWIGAAHARNEYLLFVDADLRLAPDAVSRMIAELHLRRASLISGVPTEIAKTWSEQLTMPLITFVLLGYLPMERVRATNDPSFAAGIGQIFLCERDAYFHCGGHAAIRETLHDGLRLPKLFREHGFHTDLFDASKIATCRMYANFSQVWSGLAKNAVEGMASPKVIWIFTLLLSLGHVLPPVLLVLSIAERHWTSAAVALAAMVLSLMTRLTQAVCFRQNKGWALAHPLGVLLLLAIQWYALMRHQLGLTSSWKGRAYSISASSSAKE